MACILFRRQRSSIDIVQTPMKRFQLMQRVNPEGLYGCIQACLPHFYANTVENGDSKGIGRVIVVSPPVYSRFFRGKTAYAVGKVGMSVLTMGLAMDWQREGRDAMAINSIWPASVRNVLLILSIPLSRWQAIESAATQNPQTDRSELRTAAIFSDAILAMLKASPSDVSGHCFLDEDFLRSQEGVTDFTKYALVPGTTPRRIMPATFPDLRVAEQNDEGNRMDSTEMRKSKL